MVKKSHKFGPLKHEFYYIKGNKYHGVKKDYVKNIK